MSAMEDLDVSDESESTIEFAPGQSAQSQESLPASGQRSSIENLGHSTDVGNDRHFDAVPDPRDPGEELPRQSREPEFSGELEDQHAEEESYYTRPNRYYGPASTWRSWTNDDRAVVDSLDHERASDLSVHLYNAYWLRLQAQDLKGTSRRRLQKATSEIEDDEEEEAVFGPPKRWAAWPMQPREVPRDQLCGVRTDCRPSAKLEDCLINSTTKTARERWEARSWQDETIHKKQDSSNDSTSLTDSQVLQATPGSHGDDSALMNDDDNSLASLRDDRSDEDVPKMQIFSSQAVRDDNISSEADSDDEPGEHDTAPVILADEARARQLLAPSTRHVLSKLDSLLVGLHHARRAYTRPESSEDDNMAPEPMSDTSGDAARPPSRRRGRLRGPGASSVSKVDSEVSTRPSSPRTKSMRALHSKSHDVQVDRLGLRDWSDVIGMASLTGWDNGVVERASRRCAKLLGRDMQFRTFHEAEGEGEKFHFTESFASGKQPLEQEESVPHRDGADDNQATLQAGSRILCPVKTCHRSQEPFTKGSKLYLHIRKMHPHINVDDVKKLEAKRKGESRGKWTGEKRKRNPYER